ncbi:Pfs domain protein [Aspergillus piperis CBS 112811]|uniref:Pfs domain protein n=1 Tax=Aspergillus piperis CBS 112811 TaxID=1448313 RepID=A0A8G1QZV1_9EURO|nr:Pfs domain protein [Aspergillus piperis CBS 112811]RAH55200.1 Pfs domain protein [Aspergillus piperis CBS 112811]
MASNVSLSRDDYTVGWICALPLEMAAAKVMLDEIHDDLPMQPTDDNAYLLGRIGKHNVVIACLPSGVYGMTSAATVAAQLSSSFPSIRFGLMVGIGGGVPKEGVDIRLGDIVVSEPTSIYGGVVHYDHGKALTGGEFERRGMLNHPPRCLLTALSKLKSHHLTEESQVPAFLAKIMQKLSSKNATRFSRPVQEDRLFQSDYNHTNIATKSCDTCDTTKVVLRRPREDNDPVIHYGLIASGSHLLTDSHLRDKLGHGLDVRCVEMEAAGLMNANTALVIRGICDYADSHKNDVWQGYAAVAAAAYAKELLLMVSVEGSMKATAMANNPSPPIVGSLISRTFKITNYSITEIHSRHWLPLFRPE